MPKVAVTIPIAPGINVQTAISSVQSIQSAYAQAQGAIAQAQAQLGSIIGGQQNLFGGSGFQGYSGYQGSNGVSGVSGVYTGENALSNVYYDWDGEENASGVPINTVLKNYLKNLGMFKWIFWSRKCDLCNMRVRIRRMKGAILKSEPGEYKGYDYMPYKLFCSPECKLMYRLQHDTKK